MSKSILPSAVILVALLEWQERMIDFCQAQNLRIILLQPSKEEPYYWSDRVEQIVITDLTDEPNVLHHVKQLAQTYHIVAICTLYEYFVPLVAQLCATFHLPGLNPQGAQNCRHKKLTRQVLAQHRLASPQHAVIKEIAEIATALKQIPLPVIVKPSSDSGSAMVELCHAAAEVTIAVQAILSQKKNRLGIPLDPTALIEAYIIGPEYSVEACTIAGQTRILTITEKTIYSEAKPFEVRHVVPAKLPTEQEQAIAELVTSVLTALSVDYSVTHTEVRLTPQGPFIIEVNARPGGDMIAELVGAVKGHDLYELALHISLGGRMDNLPQSQLQTKTATTQYIYAEQSGVVFLNRPPKPLPSGVQTLSLYYRSGYLVRETTSNFGRLGYVIAHDTETHASPQVAQQAIDSLELHVKTDWPTVTKARLIDMIYQIRTRLTGG